MRRISTVTVRFSYLLFYFGVLGIALFALSFIIRASTHFWSHHRGSRRPASHFFLQRFQNLPDFSVPTTIESGCSEALLPGGKFE